MKERLSSQGTAAGQTVAKFSGINFAVYVPNTTTIVPNFSNLTTTAQADALRINLRTFN
jgi:hypothetical protein